MQVKVKIEVTAGKNKYVITDSETLKKDHKFYADQHASAMVGLIAERMKASLEPCFYDHQILETKND